LPENKRNLFLKIANRSDLIYVFSQNAMNILHDNYLFSNDKIKIIPHGVPIVDFCLPKNTEFRKKINEKIVFISAGHLRESKGIVFALKALKEFKEMHSDFKYYIVGANHPRNSTSISYRIYLEQLIIDLDLKNNVELINEHLPLEILIKYIQMSDIALVPYSNKNQSSSGILSLFMACGRPIISTKFQYATSILKPENGILVNFDDTIEFLHAIDYLAENELIRSQMMNANYEEAKKYHWDIVSLHYYSGMTNIVKNNFRYD
jgi:glycosyltransferase involved in cell wall biosynthesis